MKPQKDAAPRPGAGTWAEFRIDFSDESLTEIAAPGAVISGRPRQPMRMSFLFTNSSAP